MHLRALLLTTLLAGGASSTEALSIPDGQPNGLYMARYDGATGRGIHKRIYNPSSSAKFRRSYSPLASASSSASGSPALQPHAKRAATEPKAQVILESTSSTYSPPVQPADQATTGPSLVSPPEPVCLSSGALKAADRDAALAGLSSFCTYPAEAHMPDDPHGAIYLIVNDVVAYACVGPKQRLRCDANDVLFARVDIAGKCGELGSGEVEVAGFRDGATVVYGLGSTAALGSGGFCRNARRSDG